MIIYCLKKKGGKKDRNVIVFDTAADNRLQSRGCYLVTRLFMVFLFLASLIFYEFTSSMQLNVQNMHLSNHLDDYKATKEK